MSPKDEIESKVLEWVAETVELRHGVAGDDEGKLRAVSIEDGTHAILYELTRVRKRADRVDYLRTRVSMLRSQLKKAKAVAKFQSESKVMETTVHRNRTRLEFDSAAAVQAEAGLDAFEERRAAHEAQVLLDVVEDSYWIIDKIASELSSIRNDLRAIIKSLQFESSLEH